MAGTIDRLAITGDKKCRVGDYKTNNEMDAKKLLKYQKQLSYYAHILMNKGWTVEGLDIYYLNAEDGWSVETLTVLELEK
jgi:RecB family exonuclease